jgi:hypothetical protein
MQVQFIIFGEMYGNMIFPFFTGLKMLLQQKLSCLLKTGECFFWQNFFNFSKGGKCTLSFFFVPMSLQERAKKIVLSVAVLQRSSA